MLTASAEELLRRLREDADLGAEVMITPELFPDVVLLWQQGVVKIEAGQDGELYALDNSDQPL